ncbi:MAG: GtrA family protein [Cyanobacteriota bacterium]|jgi:putative flippase GtrA
MTTGLRVVKFGLVGIVATGLHLGVLFLLLRLAHWSTAPANLVAFVTAFLLSTTLQQQFTFADRLAGQRLKKRSVLLLFSANALAAYGLGSLARGGLVPLLALVPPVLNYTLLHILSGHPGFKR